MLAKEPLNAPLKSSAIGYFKEMSELVQDVFWPFRDEDPESSEGSEGGSEQSDEELRRQQCVTARLHVISSL